MWQEITVSFLNVYQRYFRRVLPSACRFTPTCSDYARQAIIKYGPWRGLLKAAKRVLTCHPFSRRGGFDPLI